MPENRADASVASAEVDDNLVLLCVPLCRVAASPYPAYKIMHINRLSAICRPVQAQRRQA
ncbi:MAG: hypothetical protein E7B59_15895 [Enterobacteriaceae bacterium]|nr:hypothetical protein [Enterobacteriaceae bacterium]